MAEHIESSSKWRIQSARLTTFFLAGETPDPSGFWSEVVGNDPSEEHKRAAAGQLQQIGEFDGLPLQLLVQPGRLDWTINLDPLLRGALEVSPVELGASFDSILASFNKLATKWLEVCPPTNRLAVGIVLTQVVADRRSGYVQLSEYLTSVKIDPDNSTDFNYQINRPRTSKVVPGLKINRLTKWGVIRSGRLMIAMTPGGTNVAQGGLEGEEFSMRLELDMSTAEDQKDELQKEDLPSIVSELIEVSTEIAVKGDVQ